MLFFKLCLFKIFFGLENSANELQKNLSSVPKTFCDMV